MEMSLDNEQKMKESPYKEISNDNDQKKDAYISENFRPQKDILFSATTILLRSPMAHNTSTSLDHLACTNYQVCGLWKLS